MSSDLRETHRGRRLKKKAIIVPITQVKEKRMTKKLQMYNFEDMYSKCMED